MTTTPSIIAKTMHVERARDGRERAGESTSPSFLTRVTLRKERLDRQALKFFHDNYTIDIDKSEASLTLRSDVTPDHER